MALIKKKDFTKMTEKELRERRAEFKLEFSRDIANSEIGGGVKSPGRIRELRRTIARIEHRLCVLDKQNKNKSIPMQKRK